MISVSKTLHLVVKKTLKHSLIVLPKVTTLRVSRMKMDVSMKPTKAESWAVNGLENTASANPPPCDRAIAAYQHIVDFAAVTLQFVNLAAELPGVQIILAETGPRVLLDIYASIDREMRETVLETVNLRDVMIQISFMPY